MLTPKTIMMSKEEVVFHMFDVGHGDSLIIEFPDPNNKSKKLFGVIDSNLYPSETLPRCLTYLKSLNVREIEFLCLTHSHFDHYNGMSIILDEFLNKKIKIKEFFDNGLSLKSALWLEGIDNKRSEELKTLYNRIIQISSNQKMDKNSTDSFYHRLAPNYILPFRKWGDLKLYILWPDEDRTFNFDCRVTKYAVNNEDNIRPTDSANDFSIVMLFVWGKKGLLLGGDVPEEEGWDIISNRLADKAHSHLVDGIELKLVKVSHHGSSYSQSESIIKKYSKCEKQIAFISGGIRENLPSHSTLSLFSKFNYDIYCTNLAHECRDAKDVRIMQPIKNHKIGQALDSISKTDYKNPSTGHGHCAAIIKKKPMDDIKVTTEGGSQNCIYKNGISCSA